MLTLLHQVRSLPNGSHEHSTSQKKNCKQFRGYWFWDMLRLNLKQRISFLQSVSDFLLFISSNEYYTLSQSQFNNKIVKYWSYFFHTTLYCLKNVMKPILMLYRVSFNQSLLHLMMGLSTLFLSKQIQSQQQKH